MMRVDIAGIEVVQAIQDIANPPYASDLACHLEPRSRGVPLVAGRRTFARVYFSKLVSRRAVRAYGELVVSIEEPGDGRREFRVNSMNAVDWRRGDPLSPALQRNSWDSSLNFELPSEACRPQGAVEIRLAALEDTRSGSAIETGVADPVLVRFDAALPLRCRALVVHYEDDETGEYLSPTDHEVDLVRHFVERSFPVAGLEWSTAGIEAAEGFTSLGPVDEFEPSHDEIASRMLCRLIAQVLAHRNQEVRAGRRDDTFYMALISDPNGRFGGVAMDSSPFPTTHTVAVSAVDDTGETAAHELAHLLGRHHPGVPDAEMHGFEVGQFEVDMRARFEIGARGHLSPDATGGGAVDGCAGLDVPSPHAAPRVLRADQHYDLMTYRYPQWLSAYNYRAIYDRLACVAKLATPGSGGRKWTAICRFDLARKDARFVHVLETSFVTPQHPDAYRNVDEFTGTHALDYLYWLNDVKGEFTPAQWSEVLEYIDSVIGGETGEGMGGRESPPGRETPVVSVSGYNRIVDLVLTRGDDDLVDALRRNNVVTSLTQPRIRVYTEYGDEEYGRDAATMWDRATEVYYRRVGDPARFPFGLFQFTMEGKGEEGSPPRRVTLMIDGIVVDQFAPVLGASDAGRVARCIFGTLGDAHGGGDAVSGDGGNDNGIARTVVTPRFPEPPGAPPTRRLENGPPPNGLVYDVMSDNYFLFYEWPDAVVETVEAARREAVRPGEKLGASVTTTIHCRRPCPSGTDADEWDVVWVSDALYGRVWIAPELIEFEYEGRRPYRRGWPYYPLPTRSVGDRREDVLTFRVELAVGFETFASEELRVSPAILEPRRGRFFKPVAEVERRIQGLSTRRVRGDLSVRFRD